MDLLTAVRWYRPVLVERPAPDTEIEDLHDDEGWYCVSRKIQLPIASEKAWSGGDLPMPT